MNALAALAALSGVVSIVAFQTGPWVLAAVAKALTTLLVIAYATRRSSGDAYARAILAGLVASLAGDVFLLWPQQGFLPGLVSFLLAHLAYLLAFTRVRRFAARWLPFALYAGVAAVLLAWLWPGLPGALRAPVLAYVACLGSMAAQAAVLWRLAPADPAARRLALGGALFLCSDSLLAINRFAMPLPLSGLWILATYWSAQGLIASWLPAASDPGAPGEVPHHRGN